MLFKHTILFILLLKYLCPQLGSNLWAKSLTSEKYATLRTYEEKIHHIIELNRSGQRTKAISLLKRLDREYPKNSEVTFYLGLYLSWEKEYKKSISYLTKSVQYNPENTDALVALTKVHAWSGDYAKSIQFLQRGLKSPDIKNKNVLYAQLGLIYFWDLDFKRSIKAYSKYLQQNPDDLTANLNMARNYYFLRSYKKALKYAKKIEQRELTTNQQLFIGDVYEKNGKFRTALKILKQKIQENPQRSDLKAKLAIMLASRSRQSEAILLLRESLAQDRTNIDNLITLGRVYSWGVNQRKSELFYKRALKLDKNNVTALNGLARLRMYQRRFERAKRIFQYVLKIDKNNIEAKNGLTQIERIFRPNISYDQREVKNTDFTNERLDEINTLTFSQKSIFVDKKITDSSSLGFQYAQILNTLQEDGLTKFDYKVEETKTALNYSYRSDWFRLRSQVAFHQAKDKNDDVFYPLDQTQSFSSYFFVLSKDWSNHRLSFSPSSEYIIYLQEENSEYFYQNILNLTDIFDFNQHYSLLGSIETIQHEFLDDFKRYRIGPRYRVHGWQNLFLEYYFTQWSNEDEISSNQFRVTYSDQWKDFFNYEIRYATLTYTPIRELLREASIFTKFSLSDSFLFIFEYVKEWEREKDRGSRFNFRLNYSF